MQQVIVGFTNTVPRYNVQTVTMFTTFEVSMSPQFLHVVVSVLTSGVLCKQCSYLVIVLLFVPGPKLAVIPLLRVT